VCGDYAAQVRHLAKTFGELPAFRAVLGERIWLQVFANSSSGSWTALLVRTDGISCVRSIGEGILI
jgi:hypothetical protein